MTQDSNSEILSENSTINKTSGECSKNEFNTYYAICEIVVAVLAVIGNAMVIYVFVKERRLRRRTNYYIVSLAAADLLVGLLGIPFAILSSLGLPRQLYVCLFTVSLLVVLCTVSIFSLVAVSLDRYWAILHPMGYSRNVRTRTALVIISICWIAGFFIGLLPMMGWRKWDQSLEKFDGCYFLCVMDYHYLVFLYFGTIIVPALVLAAFYAHIYQVVLKQIKHTVTMNPENGSFSDGYAAGGTMLRTLGPAKTREVKATQNLSIIVLFFMVCWIPLYTINCVIAFCRHCEISRPLMLFCVILSHLNSAGNPLLYAYHLKDFRLALKNFLWSLFGLSQPNMDGPNSFLSSNHYYKSYRFRKHPTSAQSFNKNQSRYLTGGGAINNIVKKPATVALATAGQMENGIWKIEECSSQEKFDKNIFRPYTSYKSRKGSYLDNSNSSLDEDDIFIKNAHRFPESQMGTCETLNTASDSQDDSRSSSPIPINYPEISSESHSSPKIYLIEVNQNVNNSNEKSLTPLANSKIETDCGKKRFSFLRKGKKNVSRSMSEEVVTNRRGVITNQSYKYRGSCGG